MFNKRGRVTSPSVTRAHLASITNLPGSPCSPSPSPHPKTLLSTSHGATSNPLRKQQLGRRASYQLTSPLTNHQATTIRQESSAFLASPFVPNIMTPTHPEDAFPNPIRRRPQSMAFKATMPSPSPRPALEHRGHSDPSSTRSSNGLMRYDLQAREDRPRQLPFETPSKLGAQPRIDSARQRITRWIDESSTSALGQSPEVIRPSLGSRHRSSFTQTLYAMDAADKSKRSVGSLSESEEMDFDALDDHYTPSKPRKGSDLSRTSASLRISTTQRPTLASTMPTEQIKSHSNQRIITSPLAKLHTCRDSIARLEVDEDGQEKDGFDLDELNFELDSVEVEMDSAQLSSSHPSLDLEIDAQPTRSRKHSVMPSKLDGSPEWTSSFGDGQATRRPLLTTRTRYSHGDRRHSQWSDLMGPLSEANNPFEVRAPAFPCDERFTPESPTPSGLQSPKPRSTMLDDSIQSPSISTRPGSSGRAKPPLNESENLMDQLFPKARQNSFNRPGMLRRVTAPAAATAADAGLSLPFLNTKSSKRKSLVSNASSGSPRPASINLPAGTPCHTFDGEKPSPAAFMSTGLIKKSSVSFQHAANSTASGSSVAKKPSGLHIDTQSRMPDTPIKRSSHVITTSLMSMEKAKPLHLPDSKARPAAAVTSASDEVKSSKFSQRNWERTDTTDSMATAVPGDSFKSSVRQPSGLRRKGSAMWARTTSGNWSNGSWSKQPLSAAESEEPLTPTRPFEHAGE